MKYRLFFFFLIFSVFFLGIIDLFGQSPFSKVQFTRDTILVNFVKANVENTKNKQKIFSGYKESFVTLFSKGGGLDSISLSGVLDLSFLVVETLFSSKSDNENFYFLGRSRECEVSGSLNLDMGHKTFDKLILLVTNLKSKSSTKYILSNQNTVGVDFDNNLLTYPKQLIDSYTLEPLRFVTRNIKDSSIIFSGNKKTYLNISSGYLKEPEHVILNLAGYLVISADVKEYEYKIYRDGVSIIKCIAVSETAFCVIWMKFDKDGSKPKRLIVGGNDEIQNKNSKSQLIELFDF